MALGLGKGAINRTFTLSEGSVGLTSGFLRLARLGYIGIWRERANRETV